MSHKNQLYFNKRRMCTARRRSVRFLFPYESPSWQPSFDAADVEIRSNEQIKNVCSAKQKNQTILALEVIPFAAGIQYFSGVTH